MSTQARAFHSQSPTTRPSTRLPLRSAFRQHFVADRRLSVGADAGYALADFGVDFADVLVDEIAVVVYTEGAADVDALEIGFCGDEDERSVRIGHGTEARGVDEQKVG